MDSDWCNINEYVLLGVFSFLPSKSILNCSSVCRYLYLKAIDFNVLKLFSLKYMQ